METVTIDFGRYEHLLNVETRVNVAVELIIKQKYISVEDILLILGTDEALLEASRIREEEKRQEKEWNVNHGLVEVHGVDV